MHFSKRPLRPMHFSKRPHRPMPFSKRQHRPSKRSKEVYQSINHLIFLLYEQQVVQSHISHILRGMH